MNWNDALQRIELRLAQPLNDNERALFQGVWEGKGYKQIHSESIGDRCQLKHFSSNIAPGLWKKLSIVLGEKVSKSTLQGAFARAQKRWVEEDAEKDTANFPDSPITSPAESQAWQSERSQSLSGQSISNPDLLLAGHPRQSDWGNSPDVAGFCGRLETLRRLDEHIRIEGCSLLSIVGEAGSGKTWFAKRLALNLGDQYGAVVWRSLAPSPPLPLAALIADISRAVSGEQMRLSESHDNTGPHIKASERTAETSQDLIQHLIQQLIDHPTVLVLDGFETVLQAGVHDGRYQRGYEDYADFLRQLGQRSHQSCVVLTSREQPREVLEQRGQPAVASLELDGFENLETQEFLQAQGHRETTGTWRQLTQVYGGNPRAIAAMAGLSRELYLGRIDVLLSHAEPLPYSAAQDQAAQYQRLSWLEQQILLQLSQSITLKASPEVSPEASPGSETQAPILTREALSRMRFGLGAEQKKRVQEIGREMLGQEMPGPEMREALDDPQAGLRSLLRRQLLRPITDQPGAFRFSPLMYQYICQKLL